MVSNPCESFRSCADIVFPFGDFSFILVLSSTPGQQKGEENAREREETLIGVARKLEGKRRKERKENKEEGEGRWKEKEGRGGKKGGGKKGEKEEEKGEGGKKQ